MRKNIIRKTKRSEKIKRSGSPRKTKCSFFGFPSDLNQVKQKSASKEKRNVATM